MKAHADGNDVVVPVPFRTNPRHHALARMLRVPPDGRAPGTFVIGNHESPAETVKKYGVTETGYVDTAPRAVTITAPFSMMRYPVTNALFAAFIRSRAAAGNPYVTTAEERGNAWVLRDKTWACVPGASWRHPKGPAQSWSGIDAMDAYPVTCVTWYDALACAQWLTEQEQGTDFARSAGCVYRLPTEAEWEYACRAGSAQSAFWWGDALDDEHAIHRCGLYTDRRGPEPVEEAPEPGQKRCNPWGLSDMLGNVWEWCVDPYSPDEPEYRIVRGGAWGSSSAAGRLLCYFRGRIKPDDRGDRNGFRLVYAHPLS